MPGIVDHIDGNPGNNAISNLRPATEADSIRNRGPSRNNKSGLRGVLIRGGSYGAQITVDRERRWLGSFSTPEEAQQAYREAARAAFGEFYRHHE